MKLSEVADKIDGVLVGKDREVLDFQTDSRKCEKNSLFFALKGKKRDGHEFVPEVYNRGAWAVVSKEVDFTPRIVVEDTLRALVSLAFLKVKKSFRIAITGSCGKTTTKDIVAKLLAQHGSVVKTVENYNTDVGISLSILNSPKNPRYAVLEMGARFKGDLNYLASIFKPHVSLITCVGSAHSKFIDPVVEKSSIAHETEKFVIFDDDRIENLLNTKGKRARKYVSRVKYENFNTIVKIKGKNYTFKGIWGGGQIRDLELSLSMMDELGLTYDLEVLHHFKFPSGRMNVERVGKFILMDDTYNSNLESMENSAKTAWKIANENVIWILAPMEEIEVSTVLEKMKALEMKYKPLAIFNVKDGFYPFGEIFSIEKLKKAVRRDTVVLVKGARSYRLEELVEKIKNEVL